MSHWFSLCLSKGKRLSPVRQNEPLKSSQMYFFPNFINKENNNKQRSYSLLMSTTVNSSLAREGLMSNRHSMVSVYLIAGSGKRGTGCILFLPLYLGINQIDLWSEHLKSITLIVVSAHSLSGKNTGSILSRPLASEASLKNWASQIKSKLSYQFRAEAITFNTFVLSFHQGRSFYQNLIQILVLQTPTVSSQRSTATRQRVPAQLGA